MPNHNLFWCRRPIGFSIFGGGQRLELWEHAKDGYHYASYAAAPEDRRFTWLPSLDAMQLLLDWLASRGIAEPAQWVADNLPGYFTAPLYRAALGEKP